ncbi:MAG: Gfo/Idh/MocA family oxidoreductase [Ideonella sp.]|nr:Gfo/Idh/MocA family oxidoreductase [Ideonella sp.]
MKLRQFPVVSDRKIRIAVVGCGRISKNHFGAIEQHANAFELVAVCDVDPVVLKEHSQRLQVPGYADLASMLSEEQVDLIALCTPSGLHAQQAILAAQNKVHVLTEKPMGTRLADGIAMVKACDQAGVRLFVVKQNRRNATLQLLKRAVEQGRFGRIYNVALNVFWTRPQDYYDQGNGWRGTWEFDGGAFMNQASHYIDLLDWIVGPVESVMAYTATQARDIEAEDSGVAVIRWRSGAMGTLNVSMLTYPKNLEGSITILGETGTVRIGGVAVNEIQDWQFADTRMEDAEIMAASYATTSVYGFGHPLYYKNVADVMCGAAEPETDGRSGLKSLELLVALYRSAKDGVKVSLPLEC